MLCIAKTASCRTLSPAAFQLRKLVAAGEIPDTAYACIAVIHSGPALQLVPSDARGARMIASGMPCALCLVHCFSHKKITPINSCYESLIYRYYAMISK